MHCIVIFLYRNEVVVSVQKKMAVLFKNIDISMEYFDKRRNQNNKRLFGIK